MALSKEKIQQIEAEAEDVYTNSNGYNEANLFKRQGFISGATIEAKKAECLVKALEEIWSNYGDNERCSLLARAAIEQFEKIEP